MRAGQFQYGILLVMNSENELLSTTPADLANSDKLTWKYIIKDGVVWEVSSKDEVNSILKLGKRLK